MTTNLLNLDERLKAEQQSSMSFWLPVLEGLKISIPKTIMIKLSHNICSDNRGEIQVVAAEVLKAANEIGLPFFLRTGHTSNKHQWVHSCFVDDYKRVEQQVRNLVEFSEIADMLGLPTSEWAVREYIPMMSNFNAFNGFPVSAERRFFVRDGHVECSHFYWPEEVFAPENHWRPLPDNWKHLLWELKEMTNHAMLELGRVSERISKELPGYWSIDWTLGRNGKWYLTDMARGEISYHDPSCLISGE